MKQITVFTPAYNRAYCLHRCYESLMRQTCKDFVWLVVDDGSTDDTRDLVNAWQRNDNGFDIQYVYKENGGMHTGHNTAYRLIQTELNVCIDSDDSMTDQAIEKILDFWNQNKSEEYAGIVALDIYDNGAVIGQPLPVQKDTTLYDYYRNGGKGDKKLIYRTDVITNYPEYPEYPGEKLVPLGYKYLLIDQDYKLLILNEPVCIVEYMSDGSTRNIYKQYLKNPKGFAFVRKAHMVIYKDFQERLKSCIHYTASSFIMKNGKFLRESPRKMMTLFSIPFGALLFGYIRWKARK